MTNIPRDIEIDRSRVPVAQGGWVDIAQALKDRWTIEIGEMTETVSPDEYAKLFKNSLSGMMAILKFDKAEKQGNISYFNPLGCGETTR